MEIAMALEDKSNNPSLSSVFNATEVIENLAELKTEMSVLVERTKAISAQGV